MKLIIFDCDGVLVNSEEIYLAADLDFLASIGAHFEPRTYMRAFMGLSPGVWRAKIGPAVEQKTGFPLPTDFFAQVDSYVTAQIDAKLAAIPGALQTIAEISTRRCVASSTPSQRLRWKLERTGLLELFDPHIFSSDMVQNGKPAPDIFLHAAAVMQVHPDDCIVVEDSVNGVKAAKAAGMRVIGFIAGNHCSAEHADDLSQFGADAIVTKYEDLVGAIDTLTAATPA